MTAKLFQRRQTPAKNKPKKHHPRPPPPRRKTCLTCVSSPSAVVVSVLLSRFSPSRASEANVRQTQTQTGPSFFSFLHACPLLQTVRDKHGGLTVEASSRLYPLKLVKCHLFVSACGQMKTHPPTHPHTHTHCCTMAMHSLVQCESGTLSLIPPVCAFSAPPL